MKAAFRTAFAAIPLVLAATVGAVGCGVHSDKAVAKAAVGASTEKQRDDSFEATAQLLDEKPALVDELYKTMRKHPKAMASFMKDASADLADEELARTVSGFIAEHPDAVQQVMTQSVLAIQKRPAARAAMNKALAARSDQTADILTDDPQAMGKVMSSLMTVTEKKPGARKNLVMSIHDDRQQIVALVSEDKELSRAITAEVLKEMLKDEPGLQKVVAKAGLLNEPSSLAPKNGKNAQGEGPITK